MNIHEFCEIKLNQMFIYISVVYHTQIMRVFSYPSIYPLFLSLNIEIHHISSSGFFREAFKKKSLTNVKPPFFLNEGFPLVKK